MSEEIIEWFKAYTRMIRMEYGQTMNVAGIDPDVIADVQQRVAERMIDWLEDS